LVNPAPLKARLKTGPGPYIDLVRLTPLSVKARLKTGSMP